jgi:hypothetical protein
VNYCMYSAYHFPCTSLALALPAASLHVAPLALLPAHLVQAPHNLFLLLALAKVESGWHLGQPVVPSCTGDPARDPAVQFSIAQCTST